MLSKWKGPIRWYGCACTVVDGPGSGKVSCRQIATRQGCSHGATAKAPRVLEEHGFGRGVAG